MTLQAPTDVLMIRPHHFHPNAQTAADNVFQSQAVGSTAEIAARAQSEHDATVRQLRAAGVTVHVFEDDTPGTPDSLFPNNWISTHTGGHIALFPMFAENRRRERRADVVSFLKTAYRVQDVIDYSGLEQDGLALEGTGAMVLDHLARVAYVARSNRADPVILERFCTHFGYEPMVFEARDDTGAAIYHTNVLMCVGTRFALIGLDCLPDPRRKADVAARLSEGGRDVIELTPAQISAFAGNAIELTGTDGPLLVLSQTALDALTPDQTSRLSAHACLVPLSLPTIETAGGSARCMIAGLHLAARQ